VDITPKTALLIAECIKLNRKYVGFRGSPRAPIWFVGEAPGADEDQIGYPFVGYSGKQLDGEILEAGLEGGQCAFTNPYKLRPPDNDITRIEECGISKATFEAQFIEEITHYKPTFLVPCGATPLSLLCPEARSFKGDVAISKWRGSLLHSPLFDWEHYIIPLYHPAFILREYSERSVNVLILSRLLEEFEYWRTNGRLQPLPERQLIVTPTPGEACDYLSECLNHKGGPISVDIELIDRKVPITIGLSYDPSHAISIGWFEYDRRLAVGVWRLLDKVLSTVHILGQNFTTFDANWLRCMGHSVNMSVVDDTLVRHHVLHPELSHKLDFQVMQYTREPYYKEEGKGWRSKEGIGQLMRYNCKDAAVTLEVFQRQEEEFNDQPSLRKFYNYEMELARKLYFIDQRGILVDTKKLKELDTFVIKELDDQCLKISSALGNRPVVSSKKQGVALAKVLSVKEESILNIGSTQQLKELLTNELGIKLKKDRESGNETTSEDSLNEAFAATGNQILKHILRIRELGKLKGTYIDARLSDGILYGCSAATGTVTGRRASRQNFLGFGTNLQNQPKHSDLGAKFLACHIARPGRIFVQCDQASAEEWPVQGIIADVSGNDKGIQSLIESIRTGISRHAVLASQIFGLPLEKTNDKNCLEYYLGKKVRHAGNYDMQADKMAMVMASEGYTLEKKFCAAVLQKFHEVEPDIKKVFHEYIKQTLTHTRRLRTPLGRERVFHGLHPTRDNGKVFREGYAYIPQSSVGDNTGMALLYVEAHSEGWVIQDKHDALLLEVPDNLENIIVARDMLLKAFERVLVFPNGYTVRIPIEFEIGYSVKGLKKCPEDVGGWKKIYEGLVGAKATEAIVA
jgi:uracil-DNA glycosylase